MITRLENYPLPKQVNRGFFTIITDKEFYLVFDTSNEADEIRSAIKTLQIKNSSIDFVKGSQQ